MFSFCRYYFNFIYFWEQPINFQQSTMYQQLLRLKYDRTTFCVREMRKSSNVKRAETFSTHKSRWQAKIEWNSFILGMNLKIKFLFTKKKPIFNSTDLSQQIAGMLQCSQEHWKLLVCRFCWYLRRIIQLFMNFSDVETNYFASILGS